MNSKVYFAKEITPVKVVELYRALDVNLSGKVAMKVHSGEKGNQNFLRPEFWYSMVEEVYGIIVECSTAYGGVRDNTNSHLHLMKDLSVDCDCCEVAEAPCMEDIGILVSLDPVAIDQACIDRVMNSDDPGKVHFMERVNSRNGIHTIEVAAELGFGTREYELIKL